MWIANGELPYKTPENGFRLGTLRLSRIPCAIKVDGVWILALPKLAQLLLNEKRASFIR